MSIIPYNVILAFRAHFGNPMSIQMKMTIVKNILSTNINVALLISQNNT